MGFKLFAPDAPSAAATAVLAPEGADSGVIVKELKSRFAAIITNGQGEMKGQIFRIAHLGFFDYMDTIALIGALEQVVAKASFKPAGFAFGKGSIAAQKVYAERPSQSARRAPASAGARTRRARCSIARPVQAAARTRASRIPRTAHATAGA